MSSVAHNAAHVASEMRRPPGVRMARKKMFFSSAKAERELGYTHRPADQALNDAVTWFRDNGYLR